MKRTSMNKFRIIEIYSVTYGMEYGVDELYIDRKGRESWVRWQINCGTLESNYYVPDTFGTIGKAEIEIANRQKAKYHIPKVVKEIG